jgi:tetratricopeptide (TPR) repeat protein/tRNA A-37 threonylcarbamoyl transferase component Bud32
MNLERKSAIAKFVEDEVDGIADSTIDHLPMGEVANLLMGATNDIDPTSRDYGERYTFRNIIGEGGQGIVLEAYDKFLDRNIALKAIRTHSTTIREEQLRNEARISAILEHPNIPPIYDMGADETGAPFFVMRKVEGVSLAEVLKEHHESQRIISKSANKFSRLRLLNIFVQICSAIEYAHSKNILHLDIKPQNIKLGPFGEVFILDWGFAAKKDETPKYLGGTPIYIAPERLKKEAPDEKADIYSLGVLLYRMMTGQRPFDIGGMSFKEYREKIDSLEQISPKERDASIPAELNAIIMKSMTMDKTKRYQSAHDLAMDLQRFLDGVPVTVFKAGPILRMWKFTKRHAVSTLLIMAVVLAFATSTIIMWRNSITNAQLKQAEETRAKARIPFDKGLEILQGQSPRKAEWSRSFFSKAIALDPSFSAAYLERGKQHMRLSAKNEALADFLQVIRISPNSLMAYYYAGIIQMDDKDKKIRNIEAAEQLFRKMQEIDKDNEYSNLGLARLFMLSNDNAKALKLCKRIEARNPTLTEVHFLRGDIYDNRSTPLYDINKAIDAYNKYLESPRDTPAAYANRADLLFKLGQTDGALRDYNEALKRDPDHIWALNNRGFLLYSKKNDLDGAMRDFNRAQEAMPKYHWTYMNRGAVYEYQKSWDQAMENYNWAHDLRPTDTTILQRQAACLFRQHKFGMALKLLEQALTLASNAEIHKIIYKQGLVYYAKSDYRSAYDCFSQVLKKTPNAKFNIRLLHHLAAKYIGNTKSLDKIAKYSNTSTKWQKAVIDYWQGNISFKQALNSTKSPEANTLLPFYLGAYNKNMTDDEYKRLMELTIKNGFHLYDEYVLAQSALNMAKPDKGVINTNE